MSLYDVANQFGSWQDDKIWSLGAGPTAAQDAFIGGASAFRVTNDDDVTVNSVGVGYDDQLLISGGATLTATNGTVLGPNDQGHSYGIDGIVYVDANATFSIGDALVNFGTVFLGGVGFGAVPGDMTLNGAVAFTGDGEVDLGGEENNSAWWSGDISGGGLSNYGNTIEGAGLISVTSLDNAVGTIIAYQIGAYWLTIRASTFTNEATLEVSEGATLDLGVDGATQSMTNTGNINIGFYDGFVNSGADATLAISGNYTINGSGAINFGGNNAAIVSDLSAGDTFTNGAASSIYADFTSEIGNGASISAAFNLTFYNDGDVYASGAGVTLTIDTGANTVYDPGGLLEADDGATLVIDSPTQMGQYYFLTIDGTAPAGGTIEAASGGTVEIGSAVANGPPTKFEREASGQVVVAAGGTLVVESGGSVSVPIEIDGTSGSTAGGVATLDAGGSITGTVYFETAGATLNLLSTSSTVNVSGSGGTVNLTSSQVSVTGQNDVINLSGSGDAVSLYSTNGNWDLVNGSHSRIDLVNAQSTAVGGGDTFNLGGSDDAVSLSNTNNDWDLVNGSNSRIDLVNAQSTAVGGGDTFNFGGSGDAVSLSDTNNDWDLVNGSNSRIDLVNAQSTAVGGGDTFNFGGADDAVSLSDTNNDWDLVNGSNSRIDLVNAQSTAVGGGDTFNFGGSGDAVSLNSTNNAWDLVNGSNGRVDLVSAQTTVAGGGDTIDFGGSGDAVSLDNTNNNSDVVNGSNGRVDLVNAQASLFGSGDIFNLSGADTIGLQANFGFDTINGFASSDTLLFSASDQGLLTVAQSGANTTIVLDSNDVITLTGVQASVVSAAIKY